MNTSLRKVASTILSIVVIVALIAFKVYYKDHKSSSLKTEENQYYQLDTLNNALECTTIHKQLLDFVKKADETLKKGGSVSVPLYFGTGNCGHSGDYRGKLPELDKATETYLRNFKDVTQNMDTNHDHKLSAKELDSLIDDIDALADKGHALHEIYSQTEKAWYQARLDAVGSDSSREHIHWVYTLALDIDHLSETLEKENVNVGDAEKTIAALKDHLKEMKEAMEDSGEWNQKASISTWAAGMPDYLKAAEQRLDFVKNKASSASAEQVEESIATFQEAQILDQPEHFEDTFIVPEH